MDERQFYTEKEETRKVKLVCPSCRGEFEAPVRWKVCRKKKELPRGIGEEDRKKFAKASSYMVRLDDLVACYKCRKRFELTGQSIRNACGTCSRLPDRPDAPCTNWLSRTFSDLPRLFHAVIPFSFGRPSSAREPRIRPDSWGRPASPSAFLPSPYKTGARP